MKANTQINRAVRIALACGAVTGLIASGSVFAAPQQATAANEPANNASPAGSAASTTQLKAVVVTGTKIRSTNVEQAQPITVVTAAQIKASGFATVGQVLQQITSSGSALNTETNNSGNSAYQGTGETNINLRNLGAQRTLVLVNGHRWATGIDGAVNLETIPASIIDHIEILQDGASPIYGSEAIAGVVNIITVKNFQGAEANAYVGMYNGNGHWDGLTTNDNVTIGAASAHSGIVFDASYMNANPIVGADRPISQVPLFGSGLTRGSASTPQGRFRFIAPYSGSPTSPTNTVAPSTGLTTADCPVKNFGTGATPNYLPLCDIQVTPGTPGTSASDFSPYTPDDSYNYAPFNYIQTPLRTTGIYTAAHFDLADSLTLHLTGTANQRVSHQQAAPGNGSLGLGPSNSVTYSPGEEYYPFNFPIYTVGPLGPGLVESYGRRLTELGDRSYEETENMFYLDTELDGFFDVGSSEWDWDVGYAFSKDNMGTLSTGNFNGNLLHIQENPALCAAAASAGCVPLNLFGGQTAPMTQQQLAFASYINQNTFNTEMENGYLDITNSDIANLPAGPLGFAAGYQSVGNSGAFIPDNTVAHPITNVHPITPTTGKTFNQAIYAEFNIPLLSNMPAAQSMSLDVASRYTRNTVFSNVQSNTSSRAALRWEVNQSLMLRGSWSQGFRTPDISELFSGLTNVSPITSDPCDNYLTSGVPVAVQQRCAAAGVAPAYDQAVTQIGGLVGGNPDLKPERAISKTIGFVFSPSFLPGFNATVDYYHIKVVNAIQADTVQNILTDCYVDGVASECAKITRYNNGIGNIKTILDPITNIGGTITSGIDVGLTYSLPATSVGQFEVGLQSTYTNEYSEFLPKSSGGGFSIVNLLGVERGGQIYPLSVPRWKANANLTWSRGNWQAEWKLQFIGSLVETCTDALNGTPLSLANMGVCSNPNFSNNALSTNYLGKTVYNDAHVNYSFSALNTTLTFGINNVFDKDPPSSTTQLVNSFDPTLYRVSGRFYYLSIGVKF